MEKEIQYLNFGNLGSVRCFSGEKGKVWLIGADISNLLEIKTKDLKSLFRYVPKEEQKVEKVIKNQKMRCISFEGFFAFLHLEPSDIGNKILSFLKENIDALKNRAIFGIS